MWLKRMVFLTVFSFLLGCLALPPAGAESNISTKGQETFNIDTVVEAVGEALKEAQDNNVPGFPPLKSVELTLSVVASKEGTAKIKFLVFSFGGGLSGESASTIKLKMEPPKTKDREAKALGPEQYKMALAAALNVAKQGVISAKKNLPQLITSSIEIEVAFTVKGQVEGGISIEPIGIEAGGKLTKSQGHKLKLVFSTGSQ